MPEIDFLIVFPSFALWSSQDMTPLVHKMGEHKIILIFTDLDSAKIFVDRSELPCTVSHFPDATDLREFLSCFSETDLVTFDPVDSELRIISTYTIRQVLDGIEVA